VVELVVVVVVFALCFFFFLTGLVSGALVLVLLMVMLVVELVELVANALVVARDVVLLEPHAANQTTNTGMARAAAPVRTFINAEFSHSASRTAVSIQVMPYGRCPLEIYVSVR
jgi:hypothetical protein